MTADFVRLRMDEVEGGWEPREGVKVTVLVQGGTGGVPVGPVRRILTDSDGWWMWLEDESEVVWVPGDRVVWVSAKGGETGGIRRRTGFA